MSKTLPDTEHKCFHSYIGGLLEKIGRSTTDISCPFNFNISQDKNITMWRTKVENSEKLNFYKEIKSNYKPENYLMSYVN